MIFPMPKVKLERIDPYRLLIPRQGNMKVDAQVFVSDEIPLEEEALSQLVDAASLPGVDSALATPDIHVGFGVPIGGVVATEEFISPAAVGYDINCGMRLLTTPWNPQDVDLQDLAWKIRSVIPLGEGKHNVTLKSRDLRRVLTEGVRGLLEVLSRSPSIIPYPQLLDFIDWEEEFSTLSRIERQGSLPGDPDTVPERAIERGLSQLGTLGGGNHFIELQRVEEVRDPDTAGRWGIRQGALVIMIHSGSRGLGHELGGTYMKAAAQYDRQHGVRIPNSQLALFPLKSREGEAYLGAMNCAANYAFCNRQLMAMLIKALLRREFGPAAFPLVYDVAHNLASEETLGRKKLLIHRKGATRAFPAKLMSGTPFADIGQPVLVPGSMGTSSWLLRGIDSGEASLFSTNHGAGRVMSRSQARGKRKAPGSVSDEEFNESMKGIVLVCEDRRSIKEEAPAAYKDIDEVIETVIGAGLAAPVCRLVPLAVLKG